MTKPRLTPAELESAAWRKVRAVILGKLEAYRPQAENPRNSEADRLGYCWRIDELKALLKLEEPEKEQPDAGQ